jgi:HTH-type transcriptional regulator/antitoxin HigA
MDIRIITTEADYEEALVEIDRLWNARAHSPEEARRELLAMLAHNYERTIEPLPSLDPIAAIEFRMEQQGLTRKDLLPAFGTTARASEILTRKRALTLDMIRKLHALFDIPLEALIGDSSRIKKKRRRHRTATKRPASRTRAA